MTTRMTHDVTPGRVLIVEDDPYNGPFTCELLSAAGFNAQLVVSAEDALAVLERNQGDGPDMILLDVNLPGMSGLELAESLKAHSDFQYVPVMLFTVHDSLQSKIEGLARGADDYLIKPFEPDELIARVNSMLRIRGLYKSLRYERIRNSKLAGAMDRTERLSNLLGRSAPMRKICELIMDISDSDAHVLILGESGAGKEVVARAIHRESRRSKGPFVVVNCAAYSESLLHSELFGHEKGAFTGAVKRKIGRFEQAQGGAVFLDEIGEISLATQVTLLRVVQERTFERVGGEHTLTADVRILAATNRDLQAAMAEGAFREDLYWRLNVITIEMPPLRDRKEDIPQLIANFVEKHNAKLGKNVQGFSSEAMDLIFAHNWPGNVRELENVTERAMVLTKGDIVTPNVLPFGKRTTAATYARPLPSTDLRTLERDHLVSVLRQCRWNKYMAAKMLGVSRSTLYSKIRRFGLDNEKPKRAFSKTP
jgi:two-component system response regulator HydG